MRSIHVVYGAAWSGRAAHAHRLAVSRPDALVHEIGSRHDIPLLMNSRYRCSIAILQAGDESYARRRMDELARQVNMRLCAMTFEAAPMHL